MERVERMQWALLVKRFWDPNLAALIGSPLPKTLHGQERIDFYKNREAAKRRLVSMFPPDED